MATVLPSRSKVLYVPVIPSTQYCSRPALQLAHFRHESTNTPTPINPPTLNLLTCEPT